MGRPRSPRAGSIARLSHDKAKYGALVKFVYLCEERDPVRRGQRERSITAAMDKFSIGDRRTVQRALRRFAPWREKFQGVKTIIAGFLRDWAFIEKHLTADELAQLDEVGVDIIYRFAKDRAELAHFRAALTAQRR